MTEVTTHPTPSLQSPPTTRGGMAHEEQNDSVAQSTSKSPTTSTADLSERGNKEIPVVKEEKTNDTEVFEEVVVEVARLSKEPKKLSLISLISIVHSFFLRITLHTPFLFLYFILRGREKQETKQTSRLQILIFVSYFYSSFIDFLRITLQKRKKDKCEKYVF